MRCLRAAIVLMLVAVSAWPIAGAAQAPSTFDGQWDVTLACPPHNEDDDAKGYTHRFPATVKDGYLRGVHGTEGQPSYHLLTGRITADGKAALTLDGIVNNPAYAINNAQRGKPYSYRVRAQFEASSGTGQRIGKRKCDFEFRRR